MFPKPAKPVRGTAACKRHMAAVARMTCVICGAEPVQVHHVIHDRYGRSRASDMDTIPLCVWHHDALHADKRGWREEHGPDHGFLEQVRRMME